VLRSAIVDEPDQLDAVAPRQRDVAAVIERAVDQRTQLARRGRPGGLRIAHRRSLTSAATVSPLPRSEPELALIALGSNPQCTMQSRQRGLPLAWPYLDHSVCSISSSNVRA